MSSTPTLATQRSRPPATPLGAAVTFDEVMEFYTRAGFLYPAKLTALGDRLGAIRSTWERLLVADGDLFKIVLLRRREGGRHVVKNSVCAFEYAPGLWQVQHLVSADRHERTGTLAALLDMTDWLPTAPGFIGYRLMYRPDNPGASRLFAELAEALPTHRTHAACTSYRVITDLRSLPEPASEIRVRVAEPADIASLDQLYATAHPTAPSRLAVSNLGLETLADRYAARGLERRRTILVAEAANEVGGTIACWWSAEGMNFSLLENAATDLFIDEHLPTGLRRLVAVALVGAALRAYAQRGRPYAVLVLDHRIERLLGATRPLSERPAKQYAQLTVSAEDIPTTRAHWVHYYHQLTPASSPTGAAAHRMDQG